MQISENIFGAPQHLLFFLRSFVLETFERCHEDFWLAKENREEIGIFLYEEGEKVVTYGQNIYPRIFPTIVASRRVLSDCKNLKLFRILFYIIITNV